MTRLPRVGGTRAKGQVSTRITEPRADQLPFSESWAWSSSWSGGRVVGPTPPQLDIPVPIPPLDCDPLDHNLLEIRSLSPRFQPNKRPRTTFLPTAAIAP
jgi:hypothetical protein